MRGLQEQPQIGEHPPRRREMRGPQLLRHGLTCLIERARACLICGARDCAGEKGAISPRLRVLAGVAARADGSEAQTASVHGAGQWDARGSGAVLTLPAALLSARLLKQTSVVAHARSKPRRASTDLHGQDAPSNTSNDSSASIHLIGTPRSSLQHTRGQRWVWACREWPSGLRRRGHLRKGIGRHEFCCATAMQRRPGSFSHSATQPLGHRVHRDDFCDFAPLVRLLPLARKEL